ncbi:MAG: dihydroorotase [Candidatus Sumerlaeia bacterium]
MAIYHFKGGRVIDPANNRDEKADLWLVDGKVSTRDPGRKADRLFHCKGKIVTPGLIDMHVHLREPGREDRETIATGTRAAAAGGVTSVCAIPNTDPIIDTQTGVKFILSRALSDAVVNVYPYAALTRGQKGEELAELGDLLQAGAVAFTDDGHPIMNNRVMRQGIDYARTFGALILDHCEDSNLAEGGVIREGELATRLGLPGWPAAAETIQVARDAALAEATGGRIHICHVSARESVNAIRDAKKRGVRISAETAPQYLCLTVEACMTYSTNAKCNPPIGLEQDRQALIAGLLDGTIDAIATDHAPHTAIEKDYMFTEAPNGVIGLETSFAALNTALVKTGLVPMPLLIEKMTIAPARLLDLHKGTLTDGADGDVAVFDPDLAWTVDPERFQSKARNCPWAGQELTGRAISTFVGGRLVYDDGKIVM